MTDWVAIKKEYLSGNISQEQLAKKYGVNRTSISTRAKKEEWLKQREAYRDAKIVKQIQATAEKEIDRYKKIQTVADKLLQKIEENIDSDVLNADAIKKYTSAIRDIKDLQDIKSEADRKEQEARIAKLIKETEADNDKDKTITVKIEGAEKSWTQ